MHLWSARNLLAGGSILALLAGALYLAVPATPAAPAAPAADDPAVGALPESYPWVRLAEAAKPAVVNVRIQGAAPRGEALPEEFRRFLPPGLRERLENLPQRPRRGIGTGFIIDPDGYIVTNRHVVARAETIEVTLADGRTLTGKVVGTDPETDLALLKVDAKNLPTLPLGRSDVLRVGEPVMAIGNPFGLDHTVTVGIISGTGRVIGAGRYDDFLQTDAAINPGNSGGPLINIRGEVVGIATAIVSRNGGFQGVGFAIPIDLAKPIVAQLRETGRVTRGWLGVSIQALTPELARSFGVKSREGALVASVVEDSPAARAGIRPGDIILRYDGKDVESPRALSVMVAGTKVGRRVEVVVWRDGQRHRMEIPVGDLGQSRRAEAGGDEGGSKVASLGVEVEPLTPERARELGVEPGEGVVVTDVRSGSAAETAGLAAGDVIREVNRVPVRSPADLERGLARTREGRALLRVEREGAARYLVVQTG